MEDIVQEIIGSSAARLMAQALISIACLPMWAECLLHCCTEVTEGLDFWECSSLAINCSTIF